MRSFPRSSVPSCALLALAATFGSPARAADHSDTALLNQIARQDAQLTDLHAFVRNGNLVLAVATNPAIPVSAATYQFPGDMVVEIHVDYDSAVRFDNALDLARYGGTIEAPARIEGDVVFRVTFDAAGAATLTIVEGNDSDGDDEHDDEADDEDDDLDGIDPSQVRFFAGLRDDPFIRCPRAGRNVGAIVLELDLSAVLGDQDTLLIWATSDIDDVFGSSEEIAGRSLRSMFPENDMANVYPPGQHAAKLGMVPDVMIYDTSRAAAFPNGRALSDDVVGLVADPRVVNTCPPFPTGNDVAFLPVFPYLAAPHPPVP